jgi:4-aminobutyrate--pyruvate transaminase
VQFAEAEGVIVRAVLGDVLTLCPPLIITVAEIDDLFERLTRALDRTLDWATRENVMKAQ